MKSLQERLQKNYYRIHPVTDFRDLLRQSAQRHTKRIAFRWKDARGVQEVTYESAYTDVRGLGTILLEQNLKGEAIALIGKNSYGWAISYLAAACVGTVVPLDKEMNIQTIAYLINAAHCRAIIADQEFMDGFYEAGLLPADILFFCLDQEREVEGSLQRLLKRGRWLIEHGSQEFERVQINPQEFHILIFTSGTTGNPKGIMLSHSNICSNIMAISRIVRVKSSDQVLSVLPLHHTYECTLGFLLILYKGGCVTFCQGLRHLHENMEEFHPTILVTVPLLLEKFHRKLMRGVEVSLRERYPKQFQGHDGLGKFLDSGSPVLTSMVRAKARNALGGRLRLMITGAAPIRPKIIQDLRRLGFRTLQGYGLTECSPLVAANNDFYYRTDAVGMAIPDTQIQIENPDENGIGEILVKGPGVMLGYFRNPEETARCMRDGWFHTGDLGWMNGEGFLFITGRSKNVIVTKNGKKIFPEELEEHLYRSGLISEAMVTGEQYAGDDEMYVNAHVFPNLDAVRAFLKVSAPTKEEIWAALQDVVRDVNEKLPSYKRIRKLQIREKEFEKTTTKKIKR
ncbi:AMP-dependent synthetase/ligase [Bianquea renquensis]|jgi:AMP-dependent synthetase/ligase|uniref:AMP-binding protein n=1 Tax=Bianquea renquensis TaxID=2763661 RepID=A0A926DTD1_9FIRM|nr:AMP-binding protein [Bianquea renquensis]MBC8543598.1 AMP-binding protein [Bianquea renquensis]